MLSALSIRNIVLIEALDLRFEAGLGVLTGETGAGKSILLDSLGLVLGARADAGLVRQGAPQAVVSASFDLPQNHPVHLLLQENGLDGGDGGLTVRRVVKADGGSRAFINDQPVSAGLLRDLGALIVEIHGQHDDRGLLNPRGHRALLDSFGGLTDQTGNVEQAFHQWRAAQQQLDEAREELEAAARDREWLDHAVAELRNFAPEVGEESALAEERASMQKGARLAEDMTTASAMLDGAEGALSQLRQIARRLDRIAGEHELLADTLASIDSAMVEAGEASDRLAAAGEAMACDPARLDAVETRLFDLRALARKHRVEPDALPLLAEELAARAARLDAGEEGIARLTAAAHATAVRYREEAQALSAARALAAAQLDLRVAEELKPLKLDSARFRTIIEPLHEGQWSAAGMDRVEFEIATNPGAPFAPLIRIASGGELSRFILALKVALAGSRDAGTIIFDEIDRGVGGAVASAIGDRLARLAGETQVLVVTHSPQVAARGGTHWQIAKASDGMVTRTGVRPLASADRREEIARMLSGAEITDEARAQAARLLEAK